MKQKMSHQFGLRLRRVLSGVLCAVMLCGLLPEGISLSGSAQAAEAPLHWSSADLQTLNDYGIMRGNENGDMMPDKSVTRAEFVAMINRSLGYNEKAASSPFKDVASADWFSDDISISYNMGYFSGTSKNTASPYVTLTREQALVALGRNLMLQPTVGESFSYADTRSFGSWSRGYIDPAVEAGIIDANRTGDFNPRKIITRGELAGMVVRTLGTRISTSGLRNLGTVDGNVTITTSNVTLRNTTINGDLYLTGGIGLGDVHLDNVTVRGKIVDAGAGLSEKGDISVILNNVTAEELVVDSMRNQTVSLRTSGTTSIPKTSVRTSAYLDDSTSAGYGLRLIEVDGEEKTAVTLSGNIKEVHNKTPKSSLNIGEGVADKVTVDEAATGSTVTIGKDARVKELNLDAGIKVDGSGSIDKVSISANGATVAQLPDEIVIAPGITATVNKQKMDTAAAVEASSRPRLASGYPYVPENNINPTGATALFMTNKPGTIYWALTAKASGSPSEEDIISPPSYAKYILKFGKIQAKESNKEYTAKISGLTSDGSYYLSAILVDDRGSRSTMKVTAFDTPDNTTPAFSTGYPTVTASEKDAQLSAMTTKNCYLYYTVLPKGSTAPRGIDFQTGSITGNLGYGVVRMAKNSPTYIYVNDVSLEEKQPYVLYLWLTDFDGAKSSAVKAVNFTTQDRTDPIVTNLRQTKSTTTSVTAAYALNEPGTLYWAVFTLGDTSIETPSTGYTTSNWLSSKPAMERLVAGTGALKSGKSSVSASYVGKDVSFTVSGLNTKTTGTSSYTLYYTGVDAAGNWSKPIRSITIYTKDDSRPTVEQRFTSFNSDDKDEDKTTHPLADTSIRLVFDKQVGATDTDTGMFHNFLELYRSSRQSDKETLAKLLRRYIKFYVGSRTDEKNLAADKKDHPNDNNWVIDYTKATVESDGTNMIVVFPNTSNPNTDALQLANGQTYCFLISPQEGDIKDTTIGRNKMKPATPAAFTTKQAQISIDSLPVAGGEIVYNNEKYPVDFSFKFKPVSTSSSPDGICYDIMLWSDTSMDVNLFWREQGGNWQPVQSPGSTISPESGAFKFTVPMDQKTYNTVGYVSRTGNSYTFHELNDQTNGLRDDTIYEYAVSIARFNKDPDRTKWNIRANMDVTVAAGTAADLRYLARLNGSTDDWTNAIKGADALISSIGDPDPYTRPVKVDDSVAPVPASNYPSFDMRDTNGTISMMLDRPGTIYWAISKLNYVKGATPDQDKITSDAHLNVSFINYPNNLEDGFAAMPSPPSKTPWKGAAQVTPTTPLVYVSSPNDDDLISRPDENVKGELYFGKLKFERASVPITFNLSTQMELDADCWYGVYMMFDSNAQSEYAVAYKFKTHEAYTPELSLDNRNTSKTGLVGATVEQSSANVYARLISSKRKEFTIFNWTFGDLASKTHSFVCGHDVYANNLTSVEQAAAAKIKVLDAMASKQTGSSASLFDKYASDALKSEVATWIKYGTNTGGVISIPLSNQGVSVAMGPTGTNLNFGTLDSSGEYFCIGLAENSSDSTKQGFSAVEPVQRIDDTKPVVESANGTLMVKLDETKGNGTGFDDVNNLAYYVVEGDVTITYTGEVLYLSDGNTRYPFTQGGGTNRQKEGFFFYPDETDVNAEKWAGISNFAANAFYTFVVDDSAPRPVNEVNIHVKFGFSEPYPEREIGKDENGFTQYEPVRPTVLPAVDLSFGAPRFVNSNGDGVNAGSILIISNEGDRYAHAKKG